MGVKFKSSEILTHIFYGTKTLRSNTPKMLRKNNYVRSLYLKEYHSLYYKITASILRMSFRVSANEKTE